MTLSAALLGLAALGYVGSIDLGRLIDGSDRIALGRVVAVREVACDPPIGDFPFPTTRVADLEVERALVGTMPGEMLTFHAAPTWMCDVSGAEPGERLLLFLGRMDDETARTIDDPGPLHWIEHSGRGRLQVRGRRGAEWLEIYGVDLPAGLVGSRPQLADLLDHLERRIARRSDAVAPQDRGALPGTSDSGAPATRRWPLVALGCGAFGLLAALLAVRARSAHGSGKPR